MNSVILCDCTLYNVNWMSEYKGANDQKQKFNCDFINNNKKI